MSGKKLKVFKVFILEYTQIENKYNSRQKSIKTLIKKREVKKTRPNYDVDDDDKITQIKH